jgi:hypothetical protein
LRFFSETQGGAGANGEKRPVIEKKRPKRLAKAKIRLLRADPRRSATHFWRCPARFARHTIPKARREGTARVRVCPSPHRTISYRTARQSVCKSQSRFSAAQSRGWQPCPAFCKKRRGADMRYSTKRRMTEVESGWHENGRSGRSSNGSGRSWTFQIQSWDTIELNYSHMLLIK